MYQCVVFDMDGTLVNSYEGIDAAYRWACQQMDIPFPGEGFVYRAIGAPLLLVWQEACGLSPRDAQRAAAYYRDYYARAGQKQAELYGGMTDVLQKLKKAGLSLCVATLKQEGFAKEILRGFGVLSLFDTVRGMDQNDSLTKAGLILECIRDSGASRRSTILVGDSEYDADGAKKAGVDFLAVTYGFGFRNGEIPPEDASLIAESPDDIARLLAPDMGNHE